VGSGQQISSKKKGYTDVIRTKVQIKASGRTV